MKRLEIFIKVVAIAVLALSCSQQIEPTAQFAKNTSTVTLSSSVGTISPTSADSISSVVTFNWNDPKYKTGGLSQTLFTLMLSPTGTNFASFTSKSFSGVITGELLGKEINGMAFKLGGVVGQTITLDVKVVASLTNNTEPIASNIIKLTYSPFSDFSFSATSTNKVLSAASAGNNADTLSWGIALKGYSGVKSYVMQYAAGGTNFASITTITISGSSKTLTQQDLNNIAYGAGGKANTATPVDFRIAATDEQGNAMYSNVVTLTITPWAAYNSMGVIGDVVPPFNWSNDVDMYRPDPVNNPAGWTLTLYLTVGANNGIKFRADDGWNTNWGASAWPSGTGTQGGPNIPVAASGWYKIDFNAGTGAYNFTLLSPKTFSAVTITGDFNGWNPSTSSGAIALSADASGHIWTGTFTQTDSNNGQLKIVGDGSDWYGNNTFPSGFGVDNGPNNINVPVGNYFVYFNDVSGEYMFGPSANSSSYSPISMIGDFDGWPSSGDPELIQNPSNPYKYSMKYTLPVGGVKFRYNHDWTINWGNPNNFPSGVATQGANNIAVTPAATYQITFNTLTGEYYFWQ